MAAKTVGVLVKEARTAAKLTQEKLAKAAGEGLSAADIGKCERGEADLTTAQLKKIAVACGVTQTSLVNAPKNLKAAATPKTETKTAAAKKPASTTATAKKTESKTTAAKKPETKTTAAKKPASTTAAAKKTESKAAAAKKPETKTTAAKKPAGTTATAKKTEAKAAVPAGANTSMKVTATEKKLIEAYREAPADLKKAALKVLKGEYGETVNTLRGASSGAGATAADGIGEVLGGLLGNLLGGK